MKGDTTIVAFARWFTFIFKILHVCAYLVLCCYYFTYVCIHKIQQNATQYLCRLIFSNLQ